MKSNTYVQKSGAKIAMIKEVIREIKFEVEIKQIKGYKKEIGTHTQQSLKYIIRECDKRARRTRE